MARSGGRWRPMAPPLGDGIELEPQSQAGVVPQSVPSVSQDKTFDEDSSKAFDKAFHVAFNKCFAEAWRFARLQRRAVPPGVAYRGAEDGADGRLRAAATTGASAPSRLLVARSEARGLPMTPRIC